MRMDRSSHPHGIPGTRAAKAFARAAAAAFTALAVAPAFAAGCLPKVDGAWIRMPPAGLPMMAGYARISNPCKGALAIVAAHSGAFADTSLHETRVEGGMSRMRATPALRLAPGGSAVLEPGGFHLMLMGLKAPLKAGQHVPVTLTFAEAGEIVVSAEVRSA